MARAHHYHCYHRKAFDKLPAWAGEKLTIAAFSGPGTERKTFYSLKKDLDQLRQDGAAKGIVDAGVTSVGKSTEGRELWALKVGQGSGHKVLFAGCHHAREWISVEVPYLVAEYLVQQYTDTPKTEQQKRIKHLLLNREIWFVPMVNPDGHEHTLRKDRNWRPNRKAHALPAGTVKRSAANGGDVRYPAGTYTGVDLNRNYATSDWGQETFHNGHVRTSRDPQDAGPNSLWCGLAGSGEAETQALDQLIRKKGFRALISYHSFSQLLLYPDAAQAEAFVQYVGRGMDQLIDAHGNPYTYQSASAFYPTTGDIVDFYYEQVPGRPGYTPELRPERRAARSRWFSGLPEAEIGPCFEENLGAALALINCAGHDQAASDPSATVTLQAMPAKSQFVRPCWEVFKGWKP